MEDVIPQLNPGNDLSTHDGMAAELVGMLTRSNLQIPIGKARDMTNILEWLDAIANGDLIVHQKQ